MSAEGKKKRGESGIANARNIAFRYGGSKCDLSLRVGSTNHPRLAGARFLSAMALGAGLPGFIATARAYKALDEAIDNCTVERPVLAPPQPTKAAA